MNRIPENLKREMSADPFYQVCARRNLDCRGRITWEHAFTWQGRQLQEVWAIIPLCVYHHLGAGLNKLINRWIALFRATDDDLMKFGWHGAAWRTLRLSLIKKFGRYEAPTR